MIEASRAFVCIRPNTYESADEAKVLESFFRGRSGKLENTVFVLLDSDGTTKLSRAERVPQAVFGDADRLAAAMTGIAAERTASAGKALTVPLQPDLRHGLNVAACDSVALLVLHGADEQAVTALQDRLAPALWQANLPARVRCVRVVRGADPGDAARVALAATDGVALVAPEPFGRTGTVLVQIDACRTDAELVAALDAALADYRPPARQATGAHIRQGNQQGIHWPTAIPVTDPGVDRGPGGRGPRRGPDGDDGAPPRRGPGGRRGPPPPLPPPPRGL
ncbi:MAG: hypothetical protein JNM25_01385 [Planctomycetes bacterium]|nr:hypothetical protein [Planctomycetota bacterium]